MMTILATAPLAIASGFHFMPGSSLHALLAQASFTAPPLDDYLRVLPEIVLAIFGMIVMVVDPLLDPESNQKPLGTIALVGALAALASVFAMAARPGTAFSGMVQADGFSIFFHVLIIAIAAVSILSSYEYMAVQRIRAGEYYGLILFGTVGMCLMSSAIELVLIFIALEISSISTYVLAGFRRRDAASSESSLKYFLLGSFATAFFLYGAAMMFGATGSTRLRRSRAHVCRPRIQSRVRSVSHLDARRLRRRTCSSSWVDVDRAQGGGVCRAPARAGRNPRSGLVLAALGFGGPLHDTGQSGCSGAGQRQAAAGLLFDRARRIPARCIRRQA
jgi:hypothetical protein